MINWPFTDSAPVIPKFYWDVKSQEQRIKIMCILIKQLIDGLAANDELDAETRQMVEKLEAEFEKFKEHGFDDYYREQIEKWFNDNALAIYRMLAKQVYFGLTDDGYFCAYVPDSWGDVTFDTGMTYGRPDYGRLILRFDCDGTGVIDNTHESALPDSEIIRRAIEELDARVGKHDKTLYTNLDEEVS